jgi:uncharacterized protein (TIGR03435 family)
MIEVAEIDRIGTVAERVEDSMRTEEQKLMVRVILSAAMTMGIAHAQAGPAFEVSLANSRAAGGPAPHSTMTLSRTPQKLAFEAAPAGNIVAFAYDLPLDRVERRPQWMYDDYFNVAVTTAAPAGLPEQKVLLQKLLEERFALMVHRVSYQSPVYFLVAGPEVKLTATKDVGSVDVPEFHRSTVYLGEHVSMSDLAAWLYPQVALPVLDKTGLTGLFDIAFKPSVGRRSAETIIRDLRSQFGLDLQLHPGTAESLIIDRAEKPQAN